MSKKKLEIEDTGNATANLVLFFNEFLAYADEAANLTPLGVNRLISVFRDDATKDLE